MNSKKALQRMTRHFILTTRGTFMLLCALVAQCLSTASAWSMAVSLPSDGSDATPSFNAAVSALCASATDRHLVLTAGTFSFLTAPAPITCAVTIIGQGKGSTRLVRRHSNGAFLMWTRGTDTSGGGVRHLSVEAGANTTGGIAIYIQALADTNPNANSLNRHSFEVDDVLLGREAANGSWYVGIYLDGSQNPDNSNGIAPGVRTPWVARTTVSGFVQAAAYLNKARGAYLQIECFIPLGTVVNAIYMDGITQGTTVETRTCVPTWVDSQSDWLLWNWVRYR